MTHRAWLATNYPWIGAVAAIGLLWLLSRLLHARAQPQHAIGSRGMILQCVWSVAAGAVLASMLRGILYVGGYSGWLDSYFDYDSVLHGFARHNLGLLGAVLAAGIAGSVVLWTGTLRSVAAIALQMLVFGLLLSPLLGFPLLAVAYATLALESMFAVNRACSPMLAWILAGGVVGGLIGLGRGGGRHGIARRTIAALALVIGVVASGVASRTIPQEAARYVLMSTAGLVLGTALAVGAYRLLYRYFLRPRWRARRIAELEVLINEARERAHDRNSRLANLSPRTDGYYIARREPDPSAALAQMESELSRLRDEHDSARRN